MFIRIVESSELNPELTLRASDYMKRENRMSSFAIERMETGRTPKAAKALLAEEKEVPKLEVDQLWECTESRVLGGKGGARGTRAVTRRVRIVSIGETHVEADNVETGLRRTIRIGAFRAKTAKDYYPVTDGS